MRTRGFGRWLVAAAVVTAAASATPALAQGRTSAGEPVRSAVPVSQLDRLGPSIAAGPGGSWLIAFRANTGVLWTRSSSGAASPVPGNPTVAPGTSPSVVALPSGGYRIAYQAANGVLHTATPTGGVTSLGYAMAPESSPSIAVSPSGSWMIAFQSSYGELWTRSSSGVSGPVPGNPALSPATSPSIVALPSGGYQIAYQSPYGQLTIAKPTGEVTGLGLQMRWRSSPSIAVTPLSGLMIAFQGNTGELWTWTAYHGIRPRQVQLMDGTSPNLIATPNDFLVSFQSAGGTLHWMYGSGQLVDLGLGMSNGSSPAAARLSTGQWITAMEANTGMLFSVSSWGVIEDLRLGMPL
jgi:hypothetical protein